MYELSLWILRTWRKMGRSAFSLGQLGKKSKTGNFVREIYPGFSSFFFFFKETIDRGHPSLQSNLENDLRESHSDVCHSDYAF